MRKYGVILKIFWIDNNWFALTAEMMKTRQEEEEKQAEE